MNWEPRRIRSSDKFEGVETKEQQINKRDRFWDESYQQRSTAKIRSLTGSRDLNDYVEVVDGRLMRPIFRHSGPSQLFGAFSSPLGSEKANRFLIVSVEINVDLLGCGS